MIVIGLCGGSGSGKGTVAQIFAELGIPSIDTDLVYRELTASCTPCLEELRGAFGEKVIAPDGTLNRAWLAQIVFEGDGASIRRARLNEISHRHILAETRRRIELFKVAGFRAVIVDAPLLFESGFDRECDITVAVIADYQLRVERIMARDKLTRSAAEARIKSQISDDELTKLTDEVIENNGNPEALRGETIKLLTKILN